MGAERSADRAGESVSDILALAALVAKLKPATRVSVVEALAAHQSGTGPFAHLVGADLSNWQSSQAAPASTEGIMALTAFARLALKAGGIKTEDEDDLPAKRKNKTEPADPKVDGDQDDAATDEGEDGDKVKPSKKGAMAEAWAYIRDAQAVAASQPTALTVELQSGPQTIAFAANARGAAHVQAAAADKLAEARKRGAKIVASARAAGLIS